MCSYEGVRTGGAREFFSHDGSLDTDWANKAMNPSRTLKVMTGSDDACVHFFSPVNRLFGVGRPLLAQPAADPRNQLARCFCMAAMWAKGVELRMAMTVLYSDEDAHGDSYPFAVLLSAFAPPVHQFSREPTDTPQDEVFANVVLNSLRRMREVARVTASASNKSGQLDETLIYPEAVSNVLGHTASVVHLMQDGVLESVLRRVYGGVVPRGSAPDTFSSRMTRASVLEQLNTYASCGDYSITKATEFVETGMSCSVSTGLYESAAVYVLAEQDTRFSTVLTTIIPVNFGPGVSMQVLSDKYEEMARTQACPNPANSITSNDGLLYAAFEGVFGGDPDAAGVAGAPALTNYPLFLPRSDQSTLEDIAWHGKTCAYDELTEGDCVRAMNASLAEMNMGDREMDPLGGLLGGLIDEKVPDYSVDFNMARDAPGLICEIGGAYFDNTIHLFQALTVLCGMVLPDPLPCVVFWGNTSCGKTFMSEVIMASVPNSWLFSSYFTTASLRSKKAEWLIRLIYMDEMNSIIGNMKADKSYDEKKIFKQLMEGKMEGRSTMARNADHSVQGDLQSQDCHYSTLICMNETPLLFDEALQDRQYMILVTPPKGLETERRESFHRKPDKSCAAMKRLRTLTHLVLMYNCQVTVQLLPDLRILLRGTLDMMQQAFEGSYDVGSRFIREKARRDIMAANFLVMQVAPAALRATGPQKRGDTRWLARVLWHIARLAKTDVQAQLQACMSAMDSLMLATNYNANKFVACARARLEAVPLADLADCVDTFHEFVCLPAEGFKPVREHNYEKVRLQLLRHGLKLSEDSKYTKYLQDVLEAARLGGYPVVDSATRTAPIPNAPEKGPKTTKIPVLRWNKTAMRATPSHLHRALVRTLAKHRFWVEGTGEATVKTSHVVMSVYDAIFGGVADMYPKQTRVVIPPNTLLVLPTALPARAVGAALTALFGDDVMVHEDQATSISLRTVCAVYESDRFGGREVADRLQPEDIHGDEATAVVLDVVLGCLLPPLCTLSIRRPHRLWFLDNLTEYRSYERSTDTGNWLAVRGTVTGVHTRTFTTIPKYSGYKRRHVQFFKTQPRQVELGNQDEMHATQTLRVSFDELCIGLGKHDAAQRREYDAMVQYQQGTPLAGRTVSGKTNVLVNGVLNACHALYGDSLRVEHGGVAGTAQEMATFLATVQPLVGHILREMSGFPDTTLYLPTGWHCYDGNMISEPFFARFDAGAEAAREHSVDIGVRTSQGPAPRPPPLFKVAVRRAPAATKDDLMLWCQNQTTYHEDSRPPTTNGVDSPPDEFAFSQFPSYDGDGDAMVPIVEDVLVDSDSASLDLPSFTGQLDVGHYTPGIAYPEVCTHQQASSDEEQRDRGEDLMDTGGESEEEPEETAEDRAFIDAGEPDKRKPVLSSSEEEEEAYVTGPPTGKRQKVSDGDGGSPEDTGDESEEIPEEQVCSDAGESRHTGGKPPKDVSKRRFIIESDSE